ncbi:MAG: SH3 domain-containing protein [Treponemataceae bacterium]|nr:SH3 domain-containing protein [Treponemataceae bacterium]
MGWGVVLWTIESPPIPAGTVVPVYIRSNIDKVWVIGIPKEFLSTSPVGETQDKIEVPLWQITFFKQKSKARQWATSFAPFASLYGETLQDGLPIRDSPDNNGRRVYRLREGQVVKILASVQGSPVMGAEGPLPGEWLQVLTDDGVTGYCFSYRLRIFEKTMEGKEDQQGEKTTKSTSTNDAELEQILAGRWVPLWYRSMYEHQMVDLSRVEEKWGFFPSLEGGVVHIRMPDFEKSYRFTSIERKDEHTWYFPGTPIQMRLTEKDQLEVEVQESGKERRFFQYTLFPVPVEEWIRQEKERRLALYDQLRSEGSLWRSPIYGTLSFLPEGIFQWEDYEVLFPQVIPFRGPAHGNVSTGLRIPEELLSLYEGAFQLVLSSSAVGEGASSPEQPSSPRQEKKVILTFLYAFQNSELILEYVPLSSVEGVQVLRRAPAPLILRFQRGETSRGTESAPLSLGNNRWMAPGNRRG